MTPCIRRLPISGIRNRWLLYAILFLSGSASYAQLTLTYPVSRMIFQRDNANRAIVQVAGSYAQLLDSIQVRAKPRLAGQGGDTGWRRLTGAPANGQFDGSLTITGGWYSLYLRGFYNGQPVALDSLDRFGVGEVFAIVGHSNAQGASCIINGVDYCQTRNGATDDRVTCVTVNQDAPVFQQYLNSSNNRYLPGLAFSALTTNAGMSPFARVAWFWGYMGDLMAQRLNVPILLYNAGFGGSNMEHTYKSANDIPFEHGFIRYDIRMPYANLRNIMNLYVPSTGIRAVMLNHGENDRGNATGDIIQHHYGTIDKTRAEFGMPNLVWIIARSSFVSAPFQNVRQAQDQVINRAGYNTLPGPDLDQITSTTDRPDGLHFSPTGQEKAATLWAYSITNSLLASITPYPASTQPLASLSCGTGDALTLTLPAGQVEYIWSNGNEQQSQTVPVGRYSARQRTPQNRIFFPPAIQVPTGVRPAGPQISAVGSLSFCRAGSLTLLSTYAGPNRWSTGATTQQLQINGVGNYSVQAQHPAYGCLSDPSTTRLVEADRTDLALSLAVDRRTVAVGEAVTYVLTVRNNGPCDASGIQWQNRLPSPLTSVAGSATPGLVTGVVANLAAESAVDIQYQLRPTQAGLYQNSAQIIAADNLDLDSTPATGIGDGEDDIGTVDLRTKGGGTAFYTSPNPDQRPLPPVQPNQPVPDPQKADLSVQLTTSSVLIRRGQTIDFSITVQNQGGASATGVRIEHSLPAGLQFAGSSSGLTANGQTVSGLVNQLGAGQTVTLSFAATVSAQAGPGQLINGVEIKTADQPDPDSTPGNGLTNGEDDAAQISMRVGN